MTRSLMIVNTSNWEHEDYEVELQGWDGAKRKVLLKPSEYHVFTPGDGESIIGVRKVEEEKAVPYQLNGRQVLPEVHVGFSGGQAKP